MNKNVVYERPEIVDEPCPICGVDRECVWDPAPFACDGEMVWFGSLDCACCGGEEVLQQVVYPQGLALV